MISLYSRRVSFRLTLILFFSSDYFANLIAVEL